jgi:hypothetical protein
MSAITYYNACGYKFIDLDRQLILEHLLLQKPLYKKDFFVYDKALVISGEQSFLNDN